MKKTALASLLVCAGMVFAGCSNSTPAASSSASSTADSAAAANPSAKSEGVMTYQEYADAELESEVTIEAFVQAKQAWWEDKATIYAQDPDGAYFIYNAAVSQDLYDELTDGAKIKVKGYKTEWSGEVEIAEGAEVELIEGETWKAEPVDVTDLLGNEEELIKHQNQLVDFKDLTVEPAQEGSEEAFLYNYDGSGSEGDDLYFNVSKDGKTYTFVVESYLTGEESEVYKTVQELKVGDVIDCEGFLYWYEGANPHIISVTVK
ncbi:hypothetical protein [Allobaculum fili]|uniref:hypothetical protein n=2 Tax=Allobaculum TaxID=174708 RepID=UPI001E341036|nr:hypothetical protein [Allobaculum fili]